MSRFSRLEIREFVVECGEVACSLCAPIVPASGGRMVHERLSSVVKLTEVVGAFFLFCGFGDSIFYVSTMHAPFREVLAADTGSRFEEVPHEVEMFEWNVTLFIEWSQYSVRAGDLAARQRGEKID